MIANMLTESDDWAKQFLATLHFSIQQDHLLMALLNWARIKNPGNGEVMLYCYFVRALALNRNYAFDLNYASASNFVQASALTLARDRARNLDRNLALAFDLDLALARIRASHLALTRATAFDYDLACALALTQGYDQDIVMDWILLITLSWVYILNLFAQNNIAPQQYIYTFNTLYQITINKIQVNSQVALTTGLRAWSPSEQWSKDDWECFSNDLITLLREQRNLRLDWEFSEAQLKVLADYFQGATFFLECLKLANLSPTVRAHIEANLLNPPPVPAPVALPPFNRPALRQILSSRYNLDELDILAFDLDINSDEIKGDTLSSKAIALISHCERNNLLQALSDAIRAERKDIA